MIEYFWFLCTGLHRRIIELPSSSPTLFEANPFFFPVLNEQLFLSKINNNMCNEYNDDDSIDNNISKYQ